MMWTNDLFLRLLLAFGAVTTVVAVLVAHWLLGGWLAPDPPLTDDNDQPPPSR